MFIYLCNTLALAGQASRNATGEYTKTSIYGHTQGVAMGVESVCVMSGVGGSSNSAVYNAVAEYQGSDDGSESLLYGSTIISSDRMLRADEDEDLG